MTTEAAQEHPTHTPAPAPEHLGDAGRGLWDALHADLEFEPWETEIVRRACDQVDDIRHLELTLERQGGVVAGSMGQPRLNPIFAEVRQGRLAVAKLLAQLKIPDADGEPLTDAQRRAKHAATTRWTHVRALEGGRRGTPPAS